MAKFIGRDSLFGRFLLFFAHLFIDKILYLLRLYFFLTNIAKEYVNILIAKLMHHIMQKSVGKIYFPIFEPTVEHLASDFTLLEYLFLERLTQLSTRMACGNQRHPILLWLLTRRSEYFNLISMLYYILDGYISLVDYSSYTMAANFRVYVECKIEHCSPFGQAS